MAIGSIYVTKTMVPDIVGNKPMKLLLTLLAIGLLLSAKAQTIELKHLKLNGLIPYHLDLVELEFMVKGVDSITRLPEVMDMSTADSLVYIGHSYFEYDKQTQACTLAMLKFDDKITGLQIGPLTLTAQTTPADLSAYNQEFCITTQAVVLYGTDTLYDVCEISLTLNNQPIDRVLLLFFLNQQLQRVELWAPG
jgi:hypothetical protein